MKRCQLNTDMQQTVNLQFSILFWKKLWQGRRSHTHETILIFFIPLKKVFALLQFMPFIFIYFSVKNKDFHVIITHKIFSIKSDMN